MVDMPPLEDITRLIVERFNPRRIVLFGSRARGQAHEFSDVDLFIEMETDLPPVERDIRVDEIFGLRSWPMDIVVFTPAEVIGEREMTGSLVSVVESEGKVLYERPE